MFQILVYPNFCVDLTQDEYVEVAKIM